MAKQPGKSSLNDPKRREIAGRAGRQIEALVAALSAAALRGDEAIEDLVPATAARLGQLAGIVMSATFDEGEAIESMEGMLARREGAHG